MCNIYILWCKAQFVYNSPMPIVISDSSKVLTEGGDLLMGCQNNNLAPNVNDTK